uniref:Uncharacterized protein n=1 Tax=Oryza sativa subsp. japonica TaxID=39947 RepID=Q6K878_ORYSJ|nr:hypothetical protein [Oryza sativa Japonica Group]BAD21751.1 hypothetical protein [Oryza sativa Japonica Group]
MGSRTNLDQDNIMTAYYGELLKTDRQVFETQLEELLQKMASYYRKTRQGIIKQQKFMLPIHAKSKNQLMSGAPLKDIDMWGPRADSTRLDKLPPKPFKESICNGFVSWRIGYRDAIQPWA